LETTILLLLVEDEPLVQLAAVDALHGGGFQVVTASSGDEAMDVLDARIAGISGLITDVRLGAGPDGWAIARHARELKPGVAVVYTTADSAADWSVQGVPKSIMIQKPYAPAEVINAITTLLIEAKGGAQG